MASDAVCIKTQVDWYGLVQSNAACAVQVGAPKGASNCGLLFFTLFTARPTGQNSRTSLPGGLSTPIGPPSASPSQTGQSAGSSTTGIRSCNCRTGSLAVVVRITNVRRTSPGGERHPSHNPASAIV